MGIEKYMLDGGITPTSPISRPVVSRPLERKLSQGARLSKYNFLSQAFSQMRTSYAVENSNNIPMNDTTTTTTTASKPLNTDTNLNYDSMVLPHDKPKKYQIYQQHQDSSSDNMSFSSPPPLPPNAASTTSFYFEPNTNTTATRESTMTVGTLHAPLFHKQQRSTPSPISLSSPTRQKQYTSHLAVSPTIDANNVVSDVSQYSSKQSSTTTTSAALNHNKPYPFFWMGTVTLSYASLWVIYKIL